MSVSPSRKRARTESDGGGEEGGEPVAVAAGFEAPIFGARVVGQVTTLALEGEDGPLASLSLRGVAIDHAGGWYVTTKNSVLHVSAAGRVRTVATCEGGELFGLAISQNGSALFVSDLDAHKIRRVEVATGAVTAIVGSGGNGDADGVGDAAQFGEPRGLTISPDGSALFVAACGNHKIRRVEVATGAVTTLAGSGNDGDADGVGGVAEFCCPFGVTVSPDGSALFLTDYGNDKMRRVEVATGAVTTLAGGEEGGADGVGGAAHFNGARGLAISPDGSALFVADTFNNKIRRVEVATGAVTTLAGSGASGSADGVGGAAQFNYPMALAISADGSTLSVCAMGGLRQVCVAAPPPPPSFAPLVVPPSTFSADMANTWGDATLPTGLVTFLVGDDEERIEHVSKCVLCVRSVFFRTMFGIGMKERDAAVVTVRKTDLATFTALVRYLLTDQLDLGEEEGGRAQRALDLRQLAQMYQVPRLELLCAQALQESVAPATAVPLLEAAHTMGDGRLLAQCRRFVADHAAEVRASGGVEQLCDLGVAKGLLGDALDQVAELKKGATRAAAA
ncbi:hypothetical protein EMIHUDRAFT_433296 [Emiliania huxleyi CCMP1516]|uniref:BTB domain-containing protein n=2 Tax=Emiliania huxleyi TaxID=2903 RepID=A0A0D3KZT8_EMIH1|nr:hypothetical protein EMIHUDRAFT_433296 [Emiliania huxleyi CCMP1516]EOD41273.1 hypothetical protein EMIHUDRAFT_433296 [Emiliania huxleyi CCMP1516]|eukprot:XP_005793702.1 hypothetical protein EMIHUDRAFT_433296 [Emiliania huxleyi CCMP1516]